MLSHLKTLFSDISSYVISYEKSDEHHAYEHFHVYLLTEKIHNIKNCRFFDFKDIHGEYQATKSTISVINYVTKNGDYIFENIHINSSIIKSIKDPFFRFIYYVKATKKDPQQLIQNIKQETKDIRLLEIFKDFMTNPKKYNNFISSCYKFPGKSIKTIWIHEEIFNKLMNKEKYKN